MQRMQRVDEKKDEILYITEALKLLGYTIHKICARERPDAFATVQRGGKPQDLGIEHTRYRVDAPPGKCGGSPGERLAEFWREVQRSLLRRLAPRKKPLTAYVCVLLDEQRPAPIAKARDFAAELVRLAENSAPERGKRSRFMAIDAPLTLSCRNNRGHIIPQEYPLLRDYAKEVAITNTDPVVHFLWGCTNTSAAFVGVQIDRLVAIIKKKAELARSYDWRSVQERWLMICAQGSSIVGMAGWHPEWADWQRNDVVDACKSSGFHRVYFFDYLKHWCQPVWCALGRNDGTDKGGNVGE